MKKIFLLVLSFLVFTACSSDDKTELVKIGLSSETPLVVLADFTHVVLVPGLDEPLLIEIEAPWTPLSYKFENLSDQAVTIIAATYIVTDPLTGKVTTSTPQYTDPSTGETRLYFSVLRAAKDHNCDSIVDDVEATLPDITSCSNTCDLDLNNLDCSGSLLYFSKIVETSIEESELSDQYRGLSFPVEARFEGWYGHPSDPKENFYKTFFFTATAN